MEKISVVVPCYNEEPTISLFYDEITKVSENMEVNFEYIFVDDGSKDKTMEILKELANKDKRVKYIKLSRNFGKEGAMLAGLKLSTGDYVTIMDADLQDPPKLLPKMLANSILELNEYNRYSKGLFQFVGFNTKWLEYENVERVAGETKWSFWKLFKYAIEGIVSFTTAPLTMSVTIGLLFCFIAFVMIIFIIVKTLVYGDPVAGWPSLACIIIFASGVQLFSLGILGEYLSKTYLEVKNRPVYIIKETNIKEKLL